MKRTLALGLVMMVLVMSGLGCALTAPATEAPTPTETEIAQVTPISIATTPPPDTPAAPTTAPPTTSPTEAPPVEGPGGCTLRASYVADVTIPDDSELAPGADFVKTWRIRNSGTCSWEAGTQLIYTSGELLGAPAAVSVPATAPNTPVDVSVTMKAPLTPGTYRSNWQLRAPDGTQFGSLFFVQIVVPGASTPTVTPTSPATAAPPTNFTGAVTADCTRVTFAWTDGTGETAYRLEGPGLNQNLAADVISYEWNSPPTGSSTIVLIALAGDGSEIGRVSTTINVACGGVLPDLIVESITFNPATPTAYLNVQARVRVRNQGAADSGGFVVRWWGSKSAPAHACEWNVSGGLAAGAATTLECNHIYPSHYASITAKAQVDVNNVVVESNEGNNILEQATAVNAAVVAYDFVMQAPSASWKAGPPMVTLSWNGGTGDNTGFARWATAGNWETGAAVQDRCLYTHPRWVDNGWIGGTYLAMDYTVQAGDRFRATVGLLQGANAGNVTFKVMLRTQSSGNIWIAEVNDTYDSAFKTMDVDLSAYAGQRADVILQVDAGASSQQDWACWHTAAIYRYP